MHESIVLFTRHQGILPDTEITFSVKNNEENNLQYHMSLGKTHQVTGPCINKKEGKQLASQALIKVNNQKVFKCSCLNILLCRSYIRMPMTGQQLWMCIQIHGNTLTQRYVRTYVRMYLPYMKFCCSLYSFSC